MKFRCILSRTLARAAAAILPRSIFSKSNFDIWEGRGLHVLPNHFYEPVPDTRRLSDSLWDWRRKRFAFDFNADAQLALLDALGTKLKPEWKQLLESIDPISGRRIELAGSFGSVDAEILYGIVRHFKPSRIVEVGSGISTVISARALEKNRSEDGRASEFVAVEPYPAPALRGGFPGLTRLEPITAQELPLEWVERLRENDILFIDSSHVCKLGSDVQSIFSSILQSVPQGVLVHFHDIFLPSEYPKPWIRQHRLFWNEQYLLEAFLSFNPDFEVIWGGSFMHLSHPGALQAAVSRYRPESDWPGSFWIRRR